MEKQQYLTTIFWKDDYKNKLEDDIMKEEKTIKYFIEFYKKNYINTPKKDKFFERLKYRNTCFLVTSNKEK